MANTITLTADRANTALPVEFQRPDTGAWVDGVLVSGTANTYRAVLTGIPAGTYTNILKARLKGSNPEIAYVFGGTVTVVNPTTTPGTPTQLAAPANPQATALSTSSLSVTASSVANASGYKLFSSATQGGTYAQVGGTLSSPTYVNAGLNASQTRWYKFQTLGDGTTYTDSALGTAFSGTTSAAGAAYLSMNAEGDSLTVNRGGGEWFGLTKTFFTGNTSYRNWYNYAVPGEGLIGQMHTPGEENQFFAVKDTDSSAINTIAIHAGINDLQNGHSAAEVYAEMRAEHADFVAQGYRTIATCLTTSRVSGANYDHYEFWGRVQVLNNLIRAGFNSGDLPATVLMDFSTDRYVGSFQAPLDPVYFLNDFIHYTEGDTGGHGRISAFARRALPYVLSNTKKVIEYGLEADTATARVIEQWAPVGTVINNQSDAAGYLTHPFGWAKDTNTHYLNNTNGSVGYPVSLPLEIRFVSDGGPIEVFTPKYQNTGSVVLLLDGQSLSTFSTNNGSGISDSASIYKSGPIPAGRHVLTYKVVDGMTFFDTVKILSSVTSTPPSGAYAPVGTTLNNQSTTYIDGLETINTDHSGVYYNGDNGSVMPSGTSVRVRFTSNGGALKFYAPKFGSAGTIDLLLDGQPFGSINQNNGSGVSQSALQLTTDAIPAGDHILTYTNSSGTLCFFDTIVNQSA